MRKFFLTAYAAVFLLFAGCVSDAAAATKPMYKANSTVTRLNSAAGQAGEIVLQAFSLLKTKYTWGGKTPATGLDCSGFVAHVYKKAAGLTLQGTAKDLANEGKRIRKSELKEGDLVFFNTLGRPRSHVGIYVGEGRFVHALNKKAGVRIDSLSSKYYAARYEEARTLIHLENF